ncbi:Cytochrome P450 52A3 [Termitomyces sp. T112]|nr:Cytochrome P450 52A3 [Termitomyces sp. T112]KAH0586886.1 hypothetical protein H2248_005725 [Termitomyces sp. 'cryptogamus']
MMVHLPPGLHYLVRLILSWIIVSCTAYVFLDVFSRLGAPISNRVAIASALLFNPVFLFASYVWNVHSASAEARRTGSLMVPQVHDPWPLGLSLMAAMVKSFKSGYPGDVLLFWSRQYGNTYLLNLVGEPRIFTFEPDHVKAILATQFDDFEKGPIFRSQLTTLLGTGVFNSDGEMWKFHRSITRPFFTKERISHFEVFDRHSEDALDQAMIRQDEGYPIDFQDLVSRFTLDSASEFLFGHCVRSLSAGLPYPSPSSLYPASRQSSETQHPSNRFVDSFLQGQLLSALRTRYGPSWALLEFWKDRVLPHRAVIDEFAQPILEEAIRNNRTRKEQNATEKNGEELLGGTLLDHLVSQTEDRQILKDELVNLLVAARDTTASTLTFAMYMLTQHPDIVTRLRTEIAQIVGTGVPSYEQIKDMKFMRAFINETLRLYPPVPFDSRTSNKATTLPNRPSTANPDARPFYIPAHTKCSYGVFLMHRREDLWGPDALKFDPDRFLDERLYKYLVPNPFIFLPFNAGPRICLGQQFAYNEVSFLLTQLLQRYARFTLAEPTKSDGVHPGWHLTMYVKGGLWVHMEPAPLDANKAADEPGLM